MLPLFTIPPPCGVIDRREVDFRLAPPADVEAATEARRVAGDGGVVDRQGGARGVDAAAIDAGGVAGEGAADHRRRPDRWRGRRRRSSAELLVKVLPITVAVTADCCRCRRRAVAGGVAGEGAADHRHRRRPAVEAG